MFGHHPMSGEAMSFAEFVLLDLTGSQTLAWTLDSRTAAWALATRGTNWNISLRPTDWTL